MTLDRSKVSLFKKGVRTEWMHMYWDCVIGLREMDMLLAESFYSSKLIY